jgi:alpha-galactosidase
LLSHDPRDMTPEIKALLTNREVIAVDQDQLGKQGHRVLQRGAAEVWIRPLSDGTTAVALFNRGETPADIDIRWPELGLGKASAVRDLWQQQNLSPQRERFRAALPPHGTVLLRVTPRRA